jgi:hypothetical protein
MKKWVFRILIFCLLFPFIALFVGGLIVDWKGFILNLSIRLLVTSFFVFIFLIPVWVRAISIRRWQSSVKKISIIALVIISAGVTIYGFLRPQAGTSSLSWIGYVALVLYFIASVISAYFNWPGRRKESKKTAAVTLTRKSARKKNNVYVSIPIMKGTEGDASITFVNATFQKVNESKKRYPDLDFGAWLIEQIYNEKKMMAERRGAFQKKLFCSSCGAELSPELREPKQIEYELAYKDFDPFVVQITIPSITCPQCSRICGVDLDGSLNNHLSEAIIAAFKSENIKP